MILKTIVFLGIFLTYNLYAWGEHPLGSYPALQALKELKDSKPVKVESLEDFLIKEESKLAELLELQEKWLQANVSPYKHRPDELKFIANGDRKTIKERFFNSIRVNPNFKTLSYVQQLPNKNQSNCNRLNINKVTVFHDNSFWNNVKICEIKPGSFVHPIDVIATATDEPDFGLDIGLFENNETSHGGIYGFGVQAFGNPKLEFSSQTPFHIGFFHENFVVFGLAGFLKENYPHIRAYQYLELAKFAFASGHDYWGHRFLGWGSHYIQDLTQPYHSTVSPNASTGGMLWKNTIAMIGFPQSKDDMIQLLSNRHLVLEDIQRNLLIKIHSESDFDHILFKSFQQIDNDSKYPEVDYFYSIQSVAKESNSKSKIIDSLISEEVPALYVNDPTYSYDSHDGKTNIYQILKSDHKQVLINFEKPLAELFKAFGSHTRNYVRAGLKERR
ncbi:phospholipase [Leptospira sp. GIMC2001]|uniref:phospholipase n=1 Tax=Leptospira sp. GIMC2001 TaxID=1513297 RepID=UPI002348F054|nr:phospholipase [Leptospira sp. GIMC2001]WCL49288.1 phospholipase [Leptospira sp. GIMC2001]